MTASDSEFTGSIPALYDRCLGPLLFRPFAIEAAHRVRGWRPQRVLETAAGTGILTQALQRALPEAEIVATDLNPAMLDVAAQRVQPGKVSFQPADAQALPFADASFDLVICQFGVMFFPDKVKGGAEARRVLRDGGRYLAIIWDQLDRNPVSQAISEALEEEFPQDPPRFLERMPFGYADMSRIETDLHAAGFDHVEIETVELSSRVSADDAAIGMCQGSPMRSEIEALGGDALDRATIAAAHALRQFDGLDTPMSALFVTATK
jgi:ubiquinone/menaquinone biosynthesis C-methylase UbiE